MIVYESVFEKNVSSIYKSVKNDDFIPHSKKGKSVAPTKWHIYVTHIYKIIKAKNII